MVTRGRGRWHGSGPDGWGTGCGSEVETWAPPIRREGRSPCVGTARSPSDLPERCHDRHSRPLHCRHCSLVRTRSHAGLVFAPSPVHEGGGTTHGRRTHRRGRRRRSGRAGGGHRPHCGRRHRRGTGPRGGDGTQPRSHRPRWLTSDPSANPNGPTGSGRWGRARSSIRRPPRSGVRSGSPGPPGRRRATWDDPARPERSPASRP